MKKMNNSNKKKSCCLEDKSDGERLVQRSRSKTCESNNSSQQLLKNKNNNSFAEQVYSALKKVPKGKITTYKDLAHACGTSAYRAVGTALKNNPYAPKIPCHRVVSSNGNIGGFMGETSGPAIQKKINLLKKEGIHISKNKVIDFEKRRFEF